MPQVFWQRTRPPTLEALVLTVLLVLAEVALHAAPGWLLLTRCLWIAGISSLLMLDVSLVLAGGVLSVARAGGVWTRVPLAVAQVAREGEKFLISWPEGQRERRLRLKLPEPFAAALERAVASARSAEEGAVPRTLLEARRAAFICGVAVQDRLLVAVFLLFFVAVAISMWSSNPVLLLPMLVPVVGLGSSFFLGLVLLEGDRLWLLHPKRQARMVAMTAVTAATSGLTTALIRTSDPALPEIRLNAKYAGDLIRHLKRHLALRQGGGLVGEGARKPVRCSLCGRPEAVASAKERAVLICERCAGKVRFEAAEGGHGLLGKEPRPL